MMDKEKVMKSVSSMGLCSAITAVLSVVQLSIVARFLTPEDYGMFAISSIIVGAAGAFLAGVPLAIIQRDSFTEEEASSMQNWVYLVAVVLMAVVMLIGGVYSFLSERFEAFFLVALLAVNLLIVSMELMYRVWLRRRLLMQKIAFANVMGVIVSVLTAVLLAWHGAGCWAIAYAAVARTMVTMAFIRVKSGWVILPSASFSDGRPFLKFGLSRGVDQMLGQLTSKLDQIAIGSFLGQSSLGLYNVSSNVARRPADLVSPILGGVMFPVYARLRSNSGAIQEAFDASVQLLAIMMLSIAFCVSFMAPEIVNILLGERWSAAIPVLAVIPFYFSLIMMEAPCRQMAQAAGLSSRLLIWNLLSAFLIVSVIVPAVYLTSNLCAISTVLVLARLVLYMFSFVFLARGTGVLWLFPLKLVLFRVILPLAFSLWLWSFVLHYDGLYQRIIFAISAVMLCIILNLKWIFDSFNRLSD